MKVRSMDRQNEIHRAARVDLPPSVAGRIGNTRPRSWQFSAAPLARVLGIFFCGGAVIAVASLLALQIQ